MRLLAHAEAAYAAGDLPLAFKSYMLCLNICKKPGEGEEDISLKAWYGVKLVRPRRPAPSSSHHEPAPTDARTRPRAPTQVARALIAAGSSATSASGVAVPPTPLVQEFDVLSTKWLAKISAKPTKELDADLLKAVREGALAGEGGAK